MIPTPRIILALTPEGVARHLDNCLGATDDIIILARVFQRIAFTDQPGRFGGDFVPAPLYLEQATALANNPDLASELIVAIALVRP